MIEIQGVSKTYEKGASVVHALDEVSVTIEEGSFVAIVGPSGSGKSTLMNVIGLLDTPDAGTYRLDGRDVGTLGPDSGPQAALDTPTLIGVWATAPYLHDGSATTLQDAIAAHTTLNLTLTPAELDDLAAYVASIDDLESSNWTPPSATRLSR